jgi:hypothetical protein
MTYRPREGAFCGPLWLRNVDGMKRLTPSSTWWHTLPH